MESMTKKPRRRPSFTLEFKEEMIWSVSTQGPVSPSGRQEFRPGRDRSEGAGQAD